ncbi:MAG: copper chaperone CopZ [Kiritimatiellia bacterium]|jgi:copper chaperone CopZ
MTLFKQLMLIGLLTSLAIGAEEPVRYQVTGLFYPDRVHDLRETFKALPEIELIEVDVDRAEVHVRYDAKTAFPNAKPEDLIKQLDNKVRNASQHTFGVKALCTTPRTELTFIEIDVGGLDCKACSFGAYDAIYRLDGVEQATASFKTGKVTAWIHPDKTTREALEEALKKRGVTLVPAAEQ